MSSDETRMLTYDGSGSEYLAVVFTRKKSDAEIPSPIFAFSVRKNERTAVTEEVYNLLFAQGHIGNQKLKPVTI